MGYARPAASEGACFAGSAAPLRGRRAAGGKAAALAAELAAAATSAAFFARYCSAADIAERTLCGAFAGAACSVRSLGDAGCPCGSAAAPGGPVAGPPASSGCCCAPPAALLVLTAAPAVGGSCNRDELEAGCKGLLAASPAARVAASAAGAAAAAAAHGPTLAWPRLCRAAGCSLLA